MSKNEKWKTSITIAIDASTYCYIKKAAEHRHATFDRTVSEYLDHNIGKITRSNVLFDPETIETDD